MLAQLGLDVIEADLVSTSVSVSVGERGGESPRPTVATASSLTRNLRPQSRDQARTRMHAVSRVSHTNLWTNCRDILAT